MYLSMILACATTVTNDERARPAGGELAAPVRIEADGAPIDTGHDLAHSGPLLHDFDQDGLLDLVVGNFRGYLELYRNVGTAERPQFTAHGKLHAGGDVVRIHNW